MFPLVALLHDTQPTVLDFLWRKASLQNVSFVKSFEGGRLTILGHPGAPLGLRGCILTEEAIESVRINRVSGHKHRQIKHIGRSQSRHFTN